MFVARTVAVALFLFLSGLSSTRARADGSVLALRHPMTVIASGLSLEQRALLDCPTISVLGANAPRLHGLRSLRLLDGVDARDLRHRRLTLSALIAGAERPGDSTDVLDGADVDVDPLASPLSWDAELMGNAFLRLAIGERIEPARLLRRPMVITFPVDGGAGVGVRWQG